MRLSHPAFMACLMTLALFPSLAAALPPISRYQDVTVPSLTSYLINSNIIPVTDEKTLVDYLQIADCDLYQASRNSPFRRQEIMQALLRKQAAIKMSDINPLFIRLPSVLLITGYNFDMQSFNIARQSLMPRVNKIPINQGWEGICGDTRTELQVLPSAYTVVLNIPVSLYRIPLKGSLAETLLQKLDKTRTRDGEDAAVLYGMLYMQIEPIRPEITMTGATPLGMVHGQVDFIDLYADRDRKILVKRLNYLDNY